MPGESTNDRRAEDSAKYPWRLFWLLLTAAIAGALAIVPLALETFRLLTANVPPPTLPLPLIIILAAAQNLLLLAVVTGVGLLLARRLGLGAPILESWLYRRTLPNAAGTNLGYAALAGAGVGVVLAVALIIATPHLPGLPFATAARLPVWKRFLAGFYGGIDEEILTRLFLLSLFAWLGVRFIQRDKKQLSAVTFWSANVTAALHFGLGHLPSASLVMTITPAVVTLALALNGVAAVTFGYLYWKRGLEAAMIAHFCTDFVLYVVGAEVLKVL